MIKQVRFKIAPSVVLGRPRVALKMKSDERAVGELDREFSAARARASRDSLRTAAKAAMGLFVFALSSLWMFSVWSEPRLARALAVSRPADQGVRVPATNAGNETGTDSAADSSTASGEEAKSDAASAAVAPEL